MKNFYKYGMACSFFLLLALLVFRVSLGSENAFSASDANIGILAAQHRSLASISGLFSPYFGGYILGSAGSPLRFSPYALLQVLLSPFLFNDLIAPLLMVSSSMLLLCFLRMWKRSWMASVFGALTAFWLGSSTLASSGHYGKMDAALFFTAALVLIEKSIRLTGVRRMCWSVLAGAAVGCMLLAQQDVGLLFGLLLAPYTLFRLFQRSRWKFSDWVVTLLPIALAGLALSGWKAVHSYTVNINQAVSMQKKTADSKWDFITQWSFPPGEFPDMVAPGFMGWKTNDPEAPYWGVSGQSAEWPKQRSGFRSFRLDNVYLGLAPIILAIAALLAVCGKKGRKENASNRAVILFWGISILILLLLACGKFIPLYRLVIQLPLIGSIRAPIKFLHHAAIGLGILSAFGFDALLSQKELRKRTAIFAGIFGVCFLFAALVLSFAGSSITQRFASSWGESAPLIVRRMGISSFYAAVSAAVITALLKKNSMPIMLFGGVLCLLLSVDSVYLTSHYFRAENISAIRRGNAVINYLKENQGDQRVFTFERGGMYNRWIGVEFPLHGINGFWFWQAPRLNHEYRDYLSYGNRNLLALLQSTSVKYVTAPASAINQLPRKVFKPVMFYRFVMDAERRLVVQTIARPSNAQDQVLFELKQTLPRVSLFHDWKQAPAEKMNEALFSKENDLMQTVLVDMELPAPSGSGFSPVEIGTRSRNSIKVQADAEKDGVLLFTQRFQPQWSAYIDGEKTPIFRSNSLSMGVYVPAGNHEILFECTGEKTGAVLQLMGLTAAFSAAGYLAVAAVRRKTV